MAVTELVIGALVRNELLLKSCRQWLREAGRFRLEVIPLIPSPYLMRCKRAGRSSMAC